MREPVKLPLSHPMVSRIIGATFGAGRSRRPVQISCGSSAHYSPNWDGGSKTVASFLKLADMSRVSWDSLPNDKTPMPFGMISANVTLSPGFCMVEHIIFQGKDLGYRIKMNAADIPIHLPEAISLVPKEEPVEEESPAFVGSQELAQSVID